MGWNYTVSELAEAIGAQAPKDDASFSSVSTDSRTLRGGDVFFALSGERFDGSVFVDDAFAKGAVAAVATRSSDKGPCLVVPDVLAALQAFARVHRSRYSIPVIAITGSCGKTTTKDFTAAVLGARMNVVKTKGNLNNEIGCPLSLLQIDATTDAAIIEMGAASRGNISELCELASPTESTITLVAPAHLEGFGTIDVVARTKAEIAEKLPANGIFYVNVDNPWCVKAGEYFAGKKVLVGSHGDVVLKSSRFTDDGEIALDIDPIGSIRLPLLNRAHATNALIAVAIGLQHGIDEFEGPLREAAAAPARFRLVHVNGIDVFDDTYNASPASMSAALEGLAERPARGTRLAALGDMLELGPDSATYHAEIGALAGKLGIEHVFALGSHASAMIQAARDSGVPHAEVFSSHQAMADAIRSVAKPGDVLLVKGSRGMRMEGVIEALRASMA
ncbi:MAG: UDP-N-acetylmuramoyl-tripeptide--D-alanyl-D-alanine ligase [Candidatus Hydrogenedentes bacterium]|nr:UDP-N-acetylmuramoyl-tripeptide--D-alanyl-D-alanine ligase [Candidatus Hydrogenedentota bacterium]